MIAPLSYKSEYGYYGLRVNPSYDQVLGTVRKPLGIPLPERKAKWYALGPYRDLLLHAQERIDAAEESAINYRKTSKELAESAVRDGVGQSGAAHDPVFEHIHQHGERMEAQDAYETAFDAMSAEHHRETQETRRHQLMHTYAVHHMNPVIEASHDELGEAGVHHYMPEPRQPVPRRVWHTPNDQQEAFGHPQAPEFPTFETLNMGQPSNVRQATLRPDQNMTYERMRDFTVGRTWSS